jgi:hypothetical protein
MNLEIDLLQDRNLQDDTHQTETTQDVMIAQTVMGLRMVMVLHALQMMNQRHLLRVLAATGLLIELVTGQASNQHRPRRDLLTQIMAD